MPFYSIGHPVRLGRPRPIVLISSQGDRRSGIQESLRGRSDETLSLHFWGVGRPSRASGPRPIGRPMGVKRHLNMGDSVARALGPDHDIIPNRSKVSLRLKSAKSDSQVPSSTSHGPAMVV